VISRGAHTSVFRQLKLIYSKYPFIAACILLAAFSKVSASIIMPGTFKHCATNVLFRVLELNFLAYRRLYIYTISVADFYKQDHKKNNDTPMSTRLNYWITVATLANLVFVTLSVWFFPNQRIFEVTSTLAWILIAGQYYVAHRLHRGPNLDKLTYRNQR
jgi:L-asparagine transporter-like permease